MNVELNEVEANQVAASLREHARTMDRQSRSRKIVGPNYTGTRKAMREDARMMRDLANRFDGGK